MANFFKKAWGGVGDFYSELLGSSNKNLENTYLRSFDKILELLKGGKEDALGQYGRMEEIAGRRRGEIAGFRDNFKNIIRNSPLNKSFGEGYQKNIESALLAGTDANTQGAARAASDSQSGRGGAGFGGGGAEQVRQAQLGANPGITQAIAGSRAETEGARAGVEQNLLSALLGGEQTAFGAESEIFGGESAMLNALIAALTGLTGAGISGIGGLAGSKISAGKSGGIIPSII